MDVQSTLEDKMDFLALQGQAVVNNVSPKVDGLLNSLTDPGAAAAIATFTAPTWRLSMAGLTASTRWIPTKRVCWSMLQSTDTQWAWGSARRRLAGC